MSSIFTLLYSSPLTSSEELGGLEDGGKRHCMLERKEGIIHRVFIKLYSSCLPWHHLGA